MRSVRGSQSRQLAGQRALLLYPAGLEFIAAFFGCLYAGVIAVPVYPPRRNRSLNRIQAIADDAEAQVALTTELVFNRVMPLIDETPHLKQLTWLPTCQVPPEMEQQWTMPDVHGDTLAFLQYTSGSTGAPKGVVLSHANLVHNCALIAHSFEHTRSGKGVFWLPSYHDMGLIGGILQPLYIGCPNVLMSPMSFLQKPYPLAVGDQPVPGQHQRRPELRLRFVRSQDHARTAENPRSEQLARGLQRRRTGAGRNARRLRRGLRAVRLPPRGLLSLFRPGRGYADRLGRTTSNGRRSSARSTPPRWPATKCSTPNPDDEGVRALVGCGENLPDQRIVIVDPDTLVSCPPGRIGEVWVYGPSVAQGYWQQPEATERVFHAKLKDTGEGPFLRTGDLGFLQDGELFITGRLKDLIIVHGVNYYPQDIERTVQQSHPRLRLDCGAAFTVEGEDGRERLVVVQEVERHKQSNFTDVFDAIRRDVAAEHELALDAILLIRAGSVPKTSSGKIQRHACRNGYLACYAQTQSPRGERPTPRPRRPPPPRSPRPTLPWNRTSPPLTAPSKNGKNGRRRPLNERVTQLVVEEIRRVAKQRGDGLTLDSLIVETGMDSLERMEILNSVEEKFGGRFPEEILPDLETPRQLIEAVEKYLGTQPRPMAARSADAEIPPDTYRFDQFPEYVKLRENLDMLDASGLGNPFFAVHEGLTTDRTTIAGRELHQFLQLQLPRNVGRSGRRRGRQGGDRPLRHQRLGQPAGVGPTRDPRRIGSRGDPSSSARKTPSPWWAATPPTKP